MASDGRIPHFVLPFTQSRAAFVVDERLPNTTLRVGSSLRSCILGQLSVVKRLSQVHVVSFFSSTRRIFVNQDQRNNTSCLMVRTGGAYIRC